MTPAPSPAQSCPYCQSLVADAEPAHECDACAALHHAECWGENEGCAVTGCVEAPDQVTTPAVLPAIGRPSSGSRLVVEFERPPRNLLRSTRAKSALLLCVLTLAVVLFLVATRW